MSEDNLLLVLNNWTLQDENFTTDAFAHLLRHLLERESAVGCELVWRLCGGKWTPSEADAETIKVRTQVITERGRPDMEISAPGYLVYIEVKLEALLGVEQLKSYRDQLNESSVANTVLVFLSRYIEGIPKGEEPDVSVRWYEVGAWLDEWLEQGRILHLDCKFLTTQFRDYLRGRGMTMEHVGYDLGPGIASLFNLLGMMGEALKGKQSAKFGSWQLIGFSISKTKYYLCIDWLQPEVVKFWTAGTVKQREAEELGFGHTFVDARLRWGHELNLASEEVHFYALSKAAQMECIAEFTRNCLEAAESITVGEAAASEALPGSSTQEEGTT